MILVYYDSMVNPFYLVLRTVENPLPWHAEKTLLMHSGKKLYEYVKLVYVWPQVATVNTGTKFMKPHLLISLSVNNLHKMSYLGLIAVNECCSIRFHDSGFLPSDLFDCVT